MISLLLCAAVLAELALKLAAPVVPRLALRTMRGALPSAVRVVILIVPVRHDGFR